MYVDIQKELLWYMVVASDDNYTSAIVEYGSYPDQQSATFDLRTLRKSLSDTYKGGIEGNIYRALKDFVDVKMAQGYTREDGALMHVDIALIDANWAESTESVYGYVKDSVYSRNLYPSHGRGITASAVPMSRYKQKPGERLHHDCILVLGSGQKRRHVVIDVNSWKSFAQSRIITPKGERGSLTLYGSDKTNHDLLLDHLTAEYFVVTSGNGRTLKEWRIRPDQQRNDWWDCLVGALVGLHLNGCQLAEWESAKVTSKPISLNAIAETRHNAVLGQDSMDTRKSTIDAANALKTSAKRLSLKQLQQGK